MDDNLPSNSTPRARPTTTETTATRPTTANSLLTDPFATPLSSRAPSIYLQSPSSPNASRVAFPDSVLSGPRNRTQLNGNQSSAFSSARPTSRLSSTAIANSGGASQAAALAAAVAVAAANEYAAPKSKAPRMRSHMLPDSTPVPKPWKEKKNPRAVISYWIVYFILFLGIAGGVFQCYWTYVHVPLDKLPLCMVLEENFDNEAAVFGPGGTFFREVNMNGFG